MKQFLEWVRPLFTSGVPCVTAKSLKSVAAITITAAALSSVGASAAVITFSSDLLSGNQWRYDYDVTASSGGPIIEEFTIYFNPALYANLITASSPANWDSLVIQPEASIPADGFFDSLALAGGIAAGSTLGGFSLIFDYLGNGAPGSQDFEVVDPVTFESLSVGTTTRFIVEPGSVPEPGTLALYSLALGLLFFYKKNNA